MNEKELEQTGLNPEEITLEEILADFDISDSWTEEKDLSCDKPTVPLESISQIVVPEVLPVAENQEPAVEEVPTAAVEAESAAPIPEDTVRLDELSAAAPAEQAPVTGDTVALDDISQAVASEQAPVTGDTVVLDDLSEMSTVSYPVNDDTVRLDDLSQVASGENSEAIPDTMEPLRREPIIFDPRARMRELKRQIIAGPEKHYYELSEQGVGKYQLGILLCLAVIGLSVAISVFYETGVISENRLRLTVFAQVLTMLMGGLLGSGLMIDGISDLFHGKFTLNTLLTVTFLACCGDSVFCLTELRIPVCAAFTLEVAAALWAAYHRRVTEMGQMDTLRKATRLNSLVHGEEFLDGRPAILKGMGQVEDFMDHYQKISAPERVQNFYAFFALMLSIAVAVLTGILNNLSMGVQIFSTTLLVAVPASFFISVTRPAAVLERRLHAMGTVLCGWDGVKQLCRKCMYPLYDGDIFPVGAAKLNGVKFYGSRNPEQIIAYATALMRLNGGDLNPIFEDLLISRNGARYDVENVHFYGNGGIGGEICDEPVLMGSLEFLKDMGVEIPDGVMVKQAVYVSVDGDLCGLFAINYNRMKNATMGLVSLCANRRVKTVMLAEDFMLTSSFMKEKFGVNTRRMIFPDREQRSELAAKIPEEGAPVMALTTQAGLGPAAYAVSGANALRKTCKLGVLVHVIGGLLGVLIMLALCIQGSAHLLSPIRILLYQLVWMVPGLIITEGARTI